MTTTLTQTEATRNVARWRIPASDQAAQALADHARHINPQVIARAETLAIERTRASGNILAPIIVRTDVERAIIDDLAKRAEKLEELCQSGYNWLRTAALIARPGGELKEGLTRNTDAFKAQLEAIKRGME